MLTSPVAKGHPPRVKPALSPALTLAQEVGLGRLDNPPPLPRGWHVRSVRSDIAPSPAFDFVEDELPRPRRNHVNFKATPAPIARQHVVTEALHVRHGKVFSELSGPGATFQNHDATFDTPLAQPARTSGTQIGR